MNPLYLNILNVLAPSPDFTLLKKNKWTNYKAGLEDLS